MTRPFQLFHEFWMCDLDRDLRPTFEKFAVTFLSYEIKLSYSEFCSLWRGLSNFNIEFEHVTLTVTFDLLFKSFNSGHHFFILKDRAFIYGMFVPYDKAFPTVPLIVTCDLECDLWPSFERLKHCSRELTQCPWGPSWLCQYSSFFSTLPETDIYFILT